MSVSSVRRKMAEQQAVDPELPCRACSMLAPRATLSNHGGLCGSCCAAYRRAPRPAPRIAAAALPEGMAPKHPKAWAYRLKARDEAGEQLSPLQRELYVDALRQANAVLDAARAGAPVSERAITDALQVTGDLPHWLDDVPVFEADAA